MPFINAKITKTLSDAQKEQLKAGLGAAAGVIGKAETWVMVNIEDNQAIWLGGKKKDAGAYVSFELVGSANEKDSLALSKAVCDVLENTLSIPKDSVYITIKPMEGFHWGWNGQTF
ncbi:MAG: hypothetical protein II811_04090 [Spirochaetaceae bacterium]|nr:hypothetical protein [Spirochaetaceae bacterium]